LQPPAVLFAVPTLHEHLHAPSLHVVR